MQPTGLVVGGVPGRQAAEDCAWPGACWSHPGLPKHRADVLPGPVQGPTGVEVSNLPLFSQLRPQEGEERGQNGPCSEYPHPSFFTAYVLKLSLHPLSTWLCHLNSLVTLPALKDLTTVVMSWWVGAAVESQKGCAPCDLGQDYSGPQFPCLLKGNHDRCQSRGGRGARELAQGEFPGMAAAIMRMTFPPLGSLPCSLEMALSPLFECPFCLAEATLTLRAILSPTGTMAHDIHS